MPRETLQEIGIFHSPSKLDQGYCKHVYPKYFESRRDERLTLLEIGIKKGGSLLMWQQYFPNALILGLDIRSSNIYGERIKTYQGEQQDSKILKKIIEENLPIDIIIDDGSHRANHQTASFKGLFPAMNKRGIYCVEDLQFITHSDSSQSWLIKDGFATKHDFVEYLHKLSKWPLLGYRYWKYAEPEDKKIGKLVDSIHIHNKMIVIKHA